MSSSLSISFFFRLVDWWDARGLFMPLPPRSTNDLVWFIKTTFQLFRYPLGLNLVPVSSKILQFSLPGFLFLIVGLVSLARKQTVKFLLLAAPVACTLAASGLKLYPFSERLLVFLIPPLILPIGIGVERLWKGAYLPPKAAWAVVAIFVGIPFVNSVYLLLNPGSFYKNSQFKEGIRMISERAQAGEYVYLHWGTDPFFRYYRNLYPVKAKLVVGGVPALTAAGPAEYIRGFESEFDQFKGKKGVWFLINAGNVINSGYEKTSLTEMPEKTEHEVIHKILRRMGTLKEQYHGLEVAVYQYDF